MSLRLTLVLGVFAFAATSAEARGFRVDQIPNGPVNGCANCHINPGGGGPRNAFGLDVQATLIIDKNIDEADVDWAAVAGLDSDGDGLTNAEELGDLDKDGVPDKGAPVSKPYDANDPVGGGDADTDMDTDTDTDTDVDTDTDSDPVDTGLDDEDARGCSTSPAPAGGAILLAMGALLGLRRRR